MTNEPPRKLELYGDNDDEENVVVPKPVVETSIMDPSDPYDVICSDIRKFAHSIGLTVSGDGNGGCDGTDTMKFGESEICKFDWNEMKKCPLPTKEDVAIVKRNMKQSKSEVQDSVAMAMIKMQQL